MDCNADLVWSWGSLGAHLRSRRATYPEFSVSKTEKVGCKEVFVEWTDGYSDFIFVSGGVLAVLRQSPARCRLDVKSFNLFTDSFNGSHRDDFSFSSLDNSTAPIAPAFARLPYCRLRSHSLPAPLIPDFITTLPGTVSHWPIICTK